MALVIGLGSLGILFGLFFQIPLYALPLASGFLGHLPFLWLQKRKQKGSRSSSRPCPRPSS